VTRAGALDYRGTYRPVDVQDSLALLVSRGGMAWAEAKARVAMSAELHAHPDSALAEYLGVLRDKPYLEWPYRGAGRALVAEGRDGEAVPYLEHALALTAHPESCYLLGVIAIRQKDYPRAIVLLDRAVDLAPAMAAPLYQLSLAFGLSHNLEPARAAAVRAARLDPLYPGLDKWMTVLGMTRR
jgi:tetratricopeptide (TPR) repeat protein